MVAYPLKDKLPYPICRFRRYLHKVLLKFTFLPLRLQDTPRANFLFKADLSKAVIKNINFHLTKNLGV